MRSKPLGYLILVDLILLVAWLVVIISLNVTRGPFDSYERALAYAAERHWLYYQFTYINAVLFTLLNVAVYAGLYALIRPVYPVGAAVGLAFVPIYGLIALFSYLAQIIIIPRLIALAATSELEAAATLLLRQGLQMWPESSLVYFDQFSYVILGIPALIFGLALYLKERHLRLAGALLALSGAAGLLIAPGIFVNYEPLVSSTSMASGILSMAAFVPLGVNLVRGDRSQQVQQAARPAG